MNADSALQNLLKLTAENEVVEFKEAKNNFDFGKLGKYFSALSNEANLMHKDCAWLVFGVNDNRKVVGTHYRSVRKNLDSLKEEVAKQTTNRISFVEIHEVQHKCGRVILFEIPAAPKGLLWNKLSDALDDGQKKVKISNLLTNIRRSGRIYNAGSKKVPMWRIAE